MAVTSQSYRLSGWVALICKGGEVLTAEVISEPNGEEAVGLGEAVRGLLAQGRSSALTALFLVVGTLILVTSVAVRFPDLSVYDESVHVDYVFRAEQGEVPRMGDLIQPEVVGPSLCRGVVGVRLPDCSSGDQRLGRLGAKGYQYEAQQPPVYYFVTAALRRLVALGPSDDLVLTARLTGAAWLLSGLLVLWLALARLRVRPAGAATILAIALLGPAVVYHSATVTNDAAVLLLGAVTIHFLLAARRAVTWGGLLGWSLLGAVAVWTKPQVLVAIATMALVALLRRRRPSWRPVRDDLWLLPVAVSAVAYLVWGAIVEARATVDPAVVLHTLLSFKEVSQFPGETVIAQLVGLVIAYSGPTPLRTSFVSAFGMLVVYTVVAADLRAVLNAARSSVVALAGWLSFLAVVLAGPVYTAMFFFEWSIGGGPTPRYALVLLPGMLLGLVEPVAHRKTRIWLQIVLLGLAGALAVLIINVSLRGG